ncbi:MAG: hypothetical protein O9353_15230 [Bacteroidia bacterium]|nr:hypothetical protein [Bacteroidia bacterium]
MFVVLSEIQTKESAFIYHPLQKTKLIIISTIVGTITYLVFGYFVFEIILGDYIADNTTHIPGFKKSGEQSGLFFLTLSCAAYALLISLILGYWSKTNAPIMGFKIGAIVGTLIAIMADCYWYSTSNFHNSIFPMVADIFAATITVGIMGATIAWVLSYEQTISKT